MEMNFFFYFPVTEGLMLQKVGVSPYSGDVFHEVFVLALFSIMFQRCETIT